MTTPEQLAGNANAKWGAGDIQLGELEHRFGVGKSPFTIVEKSLISGGEIVTFSSGSTEIFANRNAPLLMQGQSIKSRGLSMGAELATPVGLFSRTEGTIYLDQPLRGSNISEVFSTTKTIHSKTFGSVIKYTKIQGFDSNGTLLWHANTKGTCLCAAFGGYRYPFNLK
jgi:hypothetical protein